jgi:release factor glutamine methyltransferase
MTTIGMALQAAADRLAAVAGDDARLEAEVLFAFALSVDRTRLIAQLADPLPVDRTALLESLLVRRARHEPLAYITGGREFYGMRIGCAPAALIPRPETEMLVELALAELRARGSGLRIVEAGTGSGAIAVAIAANAPSARITATDTSSRALAIAASNMRAHGVDDRVELREADLLSGDAEIDLVVANLPYVSEGDWRTLAPEVHEWEPREALIAGEDGLGANTRLLEAARSQLASDGLLVAECGAGQGDALANIARNFFPSAADCVKKDLAGHDRVLIVRKGASA